MRAVDTNIVVRCLADVDTDEQCGVARRFVASEQVWLATTVLLESEWVLRRAFKLSKKTVHAALRDFCALPNVQLEEEKKVAAAFAWAAKGLDFGDALHLASSADCNDFVTFDRALTEAARKADALPATLLAVR